MENVKSAVQSNVKMSRQRQRRRHQFVTLHMGDDCSSSEKKDGMNMKNCWGYTDAELFKTHVSKSSSSILQLLDASLLQHT